MEDILESQSMGNSNDVEATASRQPSQDEILDRIDAIIHELESLRKIVETKRIETSRTNLADQLFGSLGKGEWAEYNLDLDWERFGK
jgi:predicted RNA-binding protein